MSIADRKEREKEQRRNSIIGAAEGLFFSRGYDNVTMDDIAKSVELNKATLYLYFKNKESLFFAIVLRGARILNAMVKENVKTSRTGFDRLWEIGHAYFSFVKKYPDYNRIQNYFFSGRFDLSGIEEFDEKDVIYKKFSYSLIDYSVFEFLNITDVGDAKEIIRLHHEIFLIMCDAIRTGKDEGAFRPDLDPVEAAIIFTLLLESIPYMRPDLKLVLESSDIDQTKFARDVGVFMRHMLMNEGPAKKE